jgi:hypothetical protein
MVLYHSTIFILKYVPSKKIIVLIVPLAMLLGGILIWQSKHSQAPVAVYTGDPQVVSTVPSGAGNIDLNNNGIPDWKEALNEIDPQVATSTTSRATSTDPLTATDVFARDLFSKFMSLQNGGTSISADNQNLLVNSVLAQTAASATQEVLTYSTADLKTNSKTDIPSLEAYGNKMGDILLQNGGTSNDFALINDGITTKDTAKLNQLVVIGKGYQRAASELTKLVVPEDAALNHLKLANGYAAMGSSLIAIASIEKDPLSTIIAVSKYPQNLQTVFNALQTAKLYFQGSGVSFDQSESGAVIMR